MPKKVREPFDMCCVCRKLVAVQGKLVCTLHENCTLGENGQCSCFQCRPTQQVPTRDMPFPGSHGGSSAKVKDPPLAGAEALLIHAASTGNIHDAYHLLNRDADVNARNINGATPLHFAAAGGLEAMVELLWSRGGDLNAQENVDVGKSSVLHHAVRAGHLQICETLIDKGSNPNMCDSLGMTPLHCAAREGMIDCFQLLMSKGADVTTLDGGGKTALYWASVMGHNEIMKFVNSESVAELTRYDFTEQWMKKALYNPVTRPKEPEGKKKKKKK